MIDISHAAMILNRHVHEGGGWVARRDEGFQYLCRIGPTGDESDFISVKDAEALVKTYENKS